MLMRVSICMFFDIKNCRSFHIDKSSVVRHLINRSRKCNEMHLIRARSKRNLKIHRDKSANTDTTSHKINSQCNVLFLLDVLCCDC